MKMAMVFLFYLLGFGVFLGVVYLCIQLGWLYQDGGKVLPGGMIMLTFFAAVVFVFFTFLGSTQLEDWEAPIRQVRAPAVDPALEHLRVKETVDAFKNKIGNAGEHVGEIWDPANFSLTMPELQGPSAGRMMTQSLSVEGFLNRMESLILRKADDPEGTSFTEKEKNDQAAFEMRARTIEEKFRKQFELPDVIMPEEMRRVEELYQAVSRGETTYEYFRYELPMKIEHARAVAKQFAEHREKVPLSIKTPVVIEIFGSRFDLGEAVMQFADVRIEPSAEELGRAPDGSDVKLRILPLKPPGKVTAVYEKYRQDQSTPPASPSTESDATP